jgi:hypothetical protein
MLARRCFAALLILVGLGASAQGQEKLELKFEKGKTYYQTMTTKTNQEMKVMGMTINQTQEQTFVFSWTPKEQKGKEWIVTQKIEAVNMKIEIGGNKIEYDSNKGDNTNNPLSDFFKALVGSEFTLTIDPSAADNKVTKIEGREEFVKKLTTANNQMEPLLKAILSDDALKQMADPAFAVVPNKPVKEGDTWEKKSTLNLGPIGSYETTYKYTYQGKDKDTKLDKIKVDTTLKYVAPGANAGQGLPFKIVKADLTSKEGTGTILFDAAKGRVASSNQTLKLEGKLTIEIGGMNTDVDLVQTQTTTVTTSDTKPK